ncbi:hypothetical protein GCM10010236_24580 [Streptomyces eurythermus]|nr:hypothetical protein GCM10010236_24580 [Streptomyces eurythermus]
MGRTDNGPRPRIRTPVLALTPGTQAPPTHPPEPTYPCCLPALGEFSQIAPREGLCPTVPDAGARTEPDRPVLRTRGRPAGTGSRALPSVM